MGILQQKKPSVALEALQDLLYGPRDHVQTTPRGVLTPELVHSHNIT